MMRQPFTTTSSPSSTRYVPTASQVSSGLREPDGKPTTPAMPPIPLRAITSAMPFTTIRAGSDAVTTVATNRTTSVSSASRCRWSTRLLSSSLKWTGVRKNQEKDTTTNMASGYPPTMAPGRQVLHQNGERLIRHSSTITRTSP